VILKTVNRAIRGLSMDLNYTEEEQAFRDKFAAFIRGNLRDISEKVLHHKRLVKDDWVRWQKILYKKGWVAPNWPKEYGGCAWTPIQQHIFEDECGYAGAPRVMPFGLVMVAPVIQHFGSKWQKEYFCRASCLRMTGGRRATPSRVRAPTWLRSSARRNL
jgi:alkylation response protein AidB-like acyl-CoA dehydrogenase